MSPLCRSSRPARVVERSETDRFWRFELPCSRLGRERRERRVFLATVPATAPARRAGRSPPAQPPPPPRGLACCGLPPRWSWGVGYRRFFGFYLGISLVLRVLWCLSRQGYENTRGNEHASNAECDQPLKLPD